MFFKLQSGEFNLIGMFYCGPLIEVNQVRCHNMVNTVDINKSKKSSRICFSAE